MRTAFALALAAGLAAGANAQDSISSTGNGDALDAYAANLQVVDYVVDLTPFTTSWGTTFGIAPIIKGSKVDPNFNTTLISAQAISKDLLLDQNPAAPDYNLWEMAPGSGVNPQNNAGAGSTVAPNSINQQSVLFAEFGTTSAGQSHNGVIGGIVNLDPANPGRLYVRRVGTAINGSGPTGNTAQFGVGSVDAHGNAYYRADDFGTGGGSIAGNNLLRTRLADRANGTLNQISGGFGATDATDVLLSGSPTAHLTPNNIPASVAGGNGVIATANFNAQYVRGAAIALPQVPGLLSNGNTDNRGSLGTTTATPLGGDYTVAVVQKNGGPENHSLGVFATDASGNILTPTATAVDLPAVVTDPTNGYSFNVPGAEFDGTGSQAAFRGGTGQVAVHEDRDGNLLVAGLVYEAVLGGGDPPRPNDNEPYNSIAVARVPAGGGAPQWVSAANSADNALNAQSGKEILDGPGGNAIGRLAALFEVTGGAPLGPSMSPPAFDAAGNIWFISAVALDITDDMGNVIGTDFDSALIRAVYNADTFTYELELVYELGQVFAGLNSGTDWTISFSGVADSNSISSGTLFSSNVSSRTFNDTPLADLDQTDSRTTAGVVANAQITYDVDGDGNFDTMTGDESYNALLYIGHVPADNPNPGCNAADLAAPFGVLDLDDIDAFILAFTSGDSAADIAPPFGVIDLDDIDAFIALFFAGCPTP